MAANPELEMLGRLQFQMLDSARKVPTIENVVSSVDLGCALDLKAIALRARNIEYDPQRFAALMMRVKEPKTTALIFATGKLVCTGAKTEQLSLTAARKYARIIQKLGYDVKFKGFKIQNMVASCDFTLPTSLFCLANSLGKFSIYEPELFPGLVYKMKQPKVTVQIFPSGKVVIAGAQNREEISKAFEKMCPALLPFEERQLKKTPKSLSPHSLLPVLA
ncbi:TATA-box binding protein [Corchorus olitorius]|uniref:TATA-box binding protein n=1 Tax=Corchorus olitorius TaxID=93759 RepID=A0A1R3GNI5_9ROSI|nr:TATA-box binding protein [Corchorus olitorius]